jgi:hypothetical protein
MKITRENYESFFLDYLEGHLEEPLVDEFIEFLRHHPDLKAELQLFEHLSIPEESISFTGKDKLYRSSLDDKTHFEHQAVAMLEGDLEDSDKAAFTAYLQHNNGARLEFEQFSKTRLIADETLQYPRKGELYRQPAIRPMLYRAMRVAAVLLVAMTIWSVWPDKTSDILNPPVISDLIPQSDPLHSQEPTSGSPAEQTPTEPLLTASAGTTIPARNAPRAADLPFAEEVIQTREELIVPDQLPIRKAAIEIRSVESAVIANMQSEPLYTETEPVEEDVYLTDRLRQRIGMEGFSFARLVRSGLDLASNVSNEKVTYATNTDGDIVALSLDTRLVGLRIPVGRK